MSEPCENPTPNINDIPDLRESFHEVSAFINRFDQVPYFQALWSDSYYGNIEAHWEHHIQSFKDGAPPSEGWRVLVLIITFDYYLGPYVGLPGSVKKKFYQWLLDEIKDQVKAK